MPELFPLVALSLAVSLDGLAAGLSYGVKNIKIPVGSLLLLSVTSGLSIALSMTFGRVVVTIISPEVAEIAGGIILVVLGSWFVYQNIHVLNHRTCNIDKEESTNIITDVLENPTAADLDRSGEISMREAIILGLALAMDAFSAGFAASLMGFHSVMTPFLVGVGKLILVPIGVKFGFKLFTNLNKLAVALLPGIILVVLGLMNFL